AALGRRAAARFEHRSGRTVTVNSLVVDGDPWVLIMGRRNGLERAISNLLDNALKFDTGDGPIELTVTADEVAVSDRGPGVDASDADKIFDRFFRADTARGLPGSGLGLAIVADVAAAHGGSGFVQPRVGGGARIGFRLGPETVLPNSKPHPALG
ncbi:MAG: sensor histidine kinase, partial [Actinomycetota bacterium]|nr:sensor histidine kinase [Actinomycetota bacterium]